VGPQAHLEARGEGVAFVAEDDEVPGEPGDHDAEGVGAGDGDALLGQDGDDLLGQVGCGELAGARYEGRLDASCSQRP
jgi:hypothetical protein